MLLTLVIPFAQVTVALNMKNGKITGLKPPCKDCKAMRLLGKQVDASTLHRAVQKVDKAGSALINAYTPGKAQAVVERVVPSAYRFANTREKRNVSQRL